jgi:ABC-type Fe3+/spermidine/putrescine transport system ATPase subunit
VEGFEPRGGAGFHNVALLGPSGCGKTTTLKLIAGLLATRTSGDIRFDGRSVLALPAERRGAVMVFQQHALFPFMSAGANVAFGLKLRGLAPKDIRRKVEDMLELVRLPGMASRMPRELSGGPALSAWPWRARSL